MTEVLIGIVFLLIALIAVFLILGFIQYMDDLDLIKTANKELEQRKRLRAGPLPQVDERHLSTTTRSKK